MISQNLEKNVSQNEAIRKYLMPQEYPDFMRRCESLFKRLVEQNRNNVQLRMHEYILLVECWMWAEKQKTRPPQFEKLLVQLEAWDKS